MIEILIFQHLACSEILTHGDNQDKNNTALIVRIHDHIMGKGCEGEYKERISQPNDKGF